MAAGLMVRKRAHKWSAKSQKHFILLSLLLLDYTRWTCLGWAKLSFTTAQKTSPERERPKRDEELLCCEILPRRSFPLYVHQTEQQQHTTSHVNAALPAIWLKQFESHELAGAGQLFHHHPSCTKSRSRCNFLMGERGYGEKLFQLALHKLTARVIFE